MSYFDTAQAEWEGTLGDAIRTLLNLNKKAGATMQFREAYIDLLEERDAYAEENGIDRWRLTINVGMIARRMLDNKLESYKGGSYTTGRWSRVKKH